MGKTVFLSAVVFFSPTHIQLSSL